MNNKYGPVTQSPARMSFVQLDPRVLTIAQSPTASIAAKGCVMKMFFLSLVLGAVCAMGAWAAVSAHTTIDEIMRRGGRPFPPGEP
jgi:hypothetical protein